MQTSHALAETACEQSVSSVKEAIKLLVTLLNGGRPEDGVHLVSNSGEEILLDTEVEGCRYILVRLPHPVQSRIRLSPREQEIVRMVAKGHPNKVIADVLNISTWTVCTHLRRIFAKLGVASRAAMVAHLLELGVVSKEPRVPGISR